MEAKPSAAPAGALCATHADKAAVFICKRCGRFACDECRKPGGALCNECFAAVADSIVSPPSWLWVVGWVFATLVGAGSGALTGVISSILYRDAATLFIREAVSILLLLCGSLAFAGVQSLALLRLKRSALQWLSVTALPLAVALFVPRLAESVFSWKPLAMGVASVALAALITPTAQWLLLRRWYTRAGLWIPGCAFGLIAGFLVAGTLIKQLPHTGVTPGTSVLLAVILLGIAVLPYALIQALLLKSMMREVRAESPMAQG